MKSTSPFALDSNGKPFVVRAVEGVVCKVAAAFLAAAGVLAGGGAIFADEVVRSVDLDSEVTPSNFVGLADGSLYATEGKCRRIGFDLELPTDGQYALEVAVSNCTDAAAAYNLSVRFGDGRLACEPAAVAAKSEGTYVFPTLALRALAVDCSLAWIEDEWTGRELAVCGIRLVRLSESVDVAAPSDDLDGDGLSPDEEDSSLTCPYLHDTDGDGLSDCDEIGVFGLSPVDGCTCAVPDAEVIDERLGNDYSALTIAHSSYQFTECGTSLCWPSAINSSPSYMFSTDKSGFHVLALDVRNQNLDLPDDYAFLFEILVNEMNGGSLKVYGCDCNRVGTGSMITPWLEPGVYSFRIRWRNECKYGNREARPALEAVRLMWVNGADEDDDGMQDWMRRRASNMPIDRDGDGIADGLEILRYRTNPLKKDTDGDGLDDKTEIAIGTSPTDADTDGDGLSDADEHLATGTDPLEPGFDADWTKVVELPASEAGARVGVWSSVEGTMCSVRRGSLDFSLTPPSPDKYYLRIDAAHFWHGRSPGTMPAGRSRIVAYSGDEIVGCRYLVHTPGMPSGFVRMPLPYASGAVDVRVAWDSVLPGLGVAIETVSLESPNGTDADGDGVQDWAVAKSVRDDAAASPAQSVFSPVCLEGVAAYPARVAVARGDWQAAAGALSVSNWFVNVSLDEGPNELVVAYENGLRAETISVAWIPLNLTLCAADLGNVRAGDTLLWTVSSSSTVNIFAEGVEKSSLAAAGGEIRTLAVDEQGSWTIRIVDSAGNERAIAFFAVAGSLPAEEPALLLGRSRQWACPDISSNLFVCASPDLSCAQTSTTNLTLNAEKMFVPHFVALRAMSGGPVVDVRKVRQFWLRNTVDTFVHIEDRGADYEVWTDDLLTMEVPGSVSVVAAIALGGVTLDTYERSATICGSSIPSASHWKMRILRPDAQKTSICHTIEAFQDGQSLGGAYRNNGTMPADMK